MNLKNTIGILICVLIFALGLLFLHRGDFNNAEINPKNSSLNTLDENRKIIPETKEDQTQVKGASVNNSITDQTPRTENADISHGDYKDYTEDSVSMESQNGKKVVLFFYASWCPYCRDADGVFKNRLKDIPSNVTILKTDFDTEKELKKKYGITYQHTFVQVDSNGLLITKWNGGDLENLNKYIK